MFQDSSLLRKQKPIKNHTPLWLWILIGLILFLSCIYALPNLYGDSPAIQISSEAGLPISAGLVTEVSQALKDQNIPMKGINNEGPNLTLRFSNTDSQMAAKEALLPLLKNTYQLAFNLLPNTPSWLLHLGASPMKYGLDLRGGLYFLLDLDMAVVIQTHLQNDESSLMNDLREANIHYSSIRVLPGEGLSLDFPNTSALNEAATMMGLKYPNLDLNINASGLNITANMNALALKDLQESALSQTVQVMRNRVNELGVAEASVARQNKGRVVIELPGVQDAARAQAIIGGTATLKAMLVNDTVDPLAAAQAHNVPPGSRLYHDMNGNPIILYAPVILTGDAISNASVGYDQQTGLPIVQVKLTGPQVGYFSEVTAQNRGHRLAIVSVESTFTQTTETVINAAVIQSQLNGSFQITGLGSARMAQNLALSIRAGALPAPVQIVEEKQVGPSLGLQNIKMGALSVVVALALIMIFISLYYGLFGVIASICLLFNLILIIAVMSLIPGATLTLPGIAGIVLNVGMAIDANVLIFERIREELRKGTSVALAIHTGYARAFSTILDSNVTTFIVAIILFAVGSGAVKGFAVTLMIGIVTSVFSALVVGRAIVNALYGRSAARRLSIGIK